MVGRGRSRIYEGASSSCVRSGVAKGSWVGVFGVLLVAAGSQLKAWAFGNGALYCKRQSFSLTLIEAASLIASSHGWVGRRGSQNTSNLYH